jgi:hypothetical protein
LKESITGRHWTVIVESTEGLDETLAGVFAPAIILPAQYYWALGHRTCLEGERKLMFAVLEDGVQCYLKNMDAKSRRRRILFFEVRDWMKAERNNGPFSFELLCQEFGMESSRVRNALQRRLTLAQAAKGRTVPGMPASSSRLAKLAVSRDPRPKLSSTEPGSSAGDCEAAL